MTGFNPLAGNPFRDRDDLARALFALLEPLRACFSPSGARVVIDAAGAAFDRAAIELEGYARPLWGLVPATLGGFEVEAWWSLYRRGLAAGTDPEHADYWGDVGPVDQRQVEAAAIGFALRCCRAQFWDPLDRATQGRVGAWLMAARNQPFSDNNWKFFRLMIDLGLEEIGLSPAVDGHERYLDEIDGFALPDGWYRDGPTRQVDHYVPFAFHYYGLLYATLAKGRGARRATFRERARRIAPHFAAWFADDGACLPIGRSLTYRFAMAGFWGALAFAGKEALPWGQVKGLFLRHLRWWSRQPITRGDGLLTVGYAYPNPLMAEAYNSANSPYWACKAFLPLALGADHPFWAAQEEAGPSGQGAILPLDQPGLVLRRDGGDVIALSSGQSNPAIRHGAEKYAKFAYSTRHAFSIESDLRAPMRCTLDAMLGLIDDDGVLRVREHCEEARIGQRGLWSRWRAFRDVTVETWLWWDGLWQLRRHHIRSRRAMSCVEGGMALAATPGLGVLRDKGRVAAWDAGDWSGIADLGGAREGRLLMAEPNTHLLHPFAAVPQLLGAIGVGETVLTCGVLATSAGQAGPRAWGDLAALSGEIPEDLAGELRSVGVMQHVAPAAV